MGALLSAFCSQVYLCTFASSYSFARFTILQIILPLLSGVPRQAVPQGFAMAAPLSDTELTALLMASPLYQKLEQIKKAVSGGAAKVGKQLNQGYFLSVFNLLALDFCTR